MIKKILICLLVFCMGCSENQSLKNFGGKATIALPVNQKLETVTWKEYNLWVLTKDMPKGHIPERYTFKERSEFGLMEGEITIIESKDEASSANPVSNNIHYNNFKMYEEH